MLLGGLRRILTPLSSPPFAIAWLGQTVSSFGDRAFALALTWLVIELTGSAVLLSSLFIAEYIPVLLLLAIGGAFADRFGPRRIILWSDLARSVVIFIFALLVSVGWVTMPVVIAFAVFSAAAALTDPALMALPPALVPQRNYTAANSLQQIGMRGAGLLGPILGGYLISRYSVAAAIAFNAVTFLGSVIAMAVIRHRRFEGLPIETLSKQGEDSAWRNLMTGMRYLRATPSVLALVLFFALTNGLNNVEEVLVPLLARVDLGASATQLGLLQTLHGIGAVAGALAMGTWGNEIRACWVAVCSGMMVFGLAIVLMGLAGSITALCGAYLLAGLAFIVPEVAAWSLWQEIVPAEMRGRVFSTISLVAMAMNPPGLILVGTLGNFIGLREGLWIGGGAIMVLSLIVSALPQFRRIDTDGRVKTQATQPGLD